MVWTEVDKNRKNQAARAATQGQQEEQEDYREKEDGDEDSLEKPTARRLYLHSPKPISPNYPVSDPEKTPSLLHQEAPPRGP